MLAAAVVIAGASGCGGNPTTSASVIADAATKTSAASTARIHESVSGSLSGRALGEGSLDGVVDGRHARGYVRFDFKFLAQADPSVNAEALEGKVVFSGKRAFLTNPAIAARLPSGKRWLEATYEQLQATGGTSGGFGGVGTLDPTKPVDHLRAVTGDAEELRGEPIDGMPTKHLRAELDYRDYVALVPASERAPLQKGVDRLEQVLGSTTSPVEVWIAPDGTIVRTKGTIEGRGLRLEYTLDLIEVGDPVRIREPDPAIVRRL